VEFRDATGDAAMPKAAAVCVLFFTCLFVSGFAWSWVRSPEVVSCWRLLDPSVCLPTILNAVEKQGTCMR